MSTKTILAVSAAVAAAVARPEVPADAKAVPAIVEAVTPILENATNNEPWYQSRVTWGVIIAGAATVAKSIFPELGLTGDEVTRLADAAATIGQGAGLALTLYGRWKAKRPIGR